MRVPTFSASCPSASDLALWVGLGGDNTHKLLQNGFDSHQSTLQGMNAWWEAINDDYDTRMVIVNTSFADTGDLVKADTYYESGATTVHFRWYNLTKNKSVPEVTAKTIAAFGTQFYYDGSTADYINERATKPGGGLYYLRNYGVAGWKDAYVVRAGQLAQAVGNVPHAGIDMYNVAFTKLLSQLYGRALVTSLNWNMQWLGCGN